MSKRVSILSLNIGNPSPERAKIQCEWLKKRPEDVFVLTETKDSRGCSSIADFFLQYGRDLFSLDTSIDYNVVFPRSSTGDLGVMIVSKHPIIKKNNFFEENNIFYARQLETVISFEDRLLNIVGLYVPSRDRSEDKVNRKRSFINSIEKYIKESENSSKVIMGDLNILEREHIPHYSTFFEWEYNFYDNIRSEGYIDAYKYCNKGRQEHSWVGRTNDGYRYDYGFVSSDLKENIISCRYIHETRSDGLTDHSAIVIELDI